MKTLSKRELQAIIRLKRLDDFKLFIQWVERSLEDQRDSNDVLEGTNLYRGQGRVQELKEITRDVARADDTLRNLNSTPSTGDVG